VATRKSRSKESHDQLVLVPKHWPDPKEGPWVVTLEFAVVDEQVTCVGMSVRGKDRLGRFMQATNRRLPIADMIDQIRRDPPQELVELVLPGRPFYKMGDLAEHGLDLLASKEPNAHKYDDAFFQWVAATYLAAPSKPTTHVAQKFNVPVTTAANWVRRARIAGHLPPAPTGSEYSQD
jgi:hypothetical protein